MKAALGDCWGKCGVKCVPSEPRIGAFAMMVHYVMVVYSILLTA